MILGIDCSRYAAKQPTGVEVYTNRIVEGVLPHLNSIGFDEIRLYVKTPYQLEYLLSQIQELCLDNIKVRLIEYRYLWTLCGLSWEMLRNKVDMLFVPSHALPLVLPKISVLTVHGVEALLYPQAYTWFQRSYQRFVLWWAKRNEAVLIAVSKSVKKNLTSILHFPEDKIKVIYNGCDLKVYKKKTSLDTGSSLRIEGDYILSIGRLEERKNQLRLIEAFELISGEFPLLKLVLVGGDGYGADRIRERFEHSEMKDRIYLSGYQEHNVVQDLMLKAKLFSYPSLAEGFGIPVLEAFDAGVPVLISNGSAPEEIAGKAVVYCDPFSVESIAMGMRTLMTDKKLVRKNVRSGKEIVKKFSWERSVNSVLDLLSKLSTQ